MSLNVVRLSSTMRKELAILLATKAHEVNLQAVTITEVKITNDLSFANIYYTCPSYLKEKVAAALEKAKGYLRSELAKSLKARKMPELLFKYDEALEYGNHINEILNELNK